jgi:hypothetical protein
MPPYYNEPFFNSIRWVKGNTSLDIATMTTAQWYRVLLEKEVTMVETDNQEMQFISSRAELASPNTDWDLTWRLARLKGLGSEYYHLKKELQEYSQTLPIVGSAPLLH